MLIQLLLGWEPTIFNFLHSLLLSLTYIDRHSSLFLQNVCIIGRKNHFHPLPPWNMAITSQTISIYWMHVFAWDFNKQAHGIEAWLQKLLDKFLCLNSLLRSMNAVLCCACRCFFVIWKENVQFGSLVFIMYFSKLTKSIWKRREKKGHAHAQTCFKKRKSMIKWYHVSSFVQYTNFICSIWSNRNDSHTVKRFTKKDS